jgi:hypothetical protein
MDEKSTEVVNAITVEPAPETKKDAVENMVVKTYQPKKSCRKCYGRGVIGYVEADPNKPYYCTCIVKVKKELTPEQTAAYKKAVAAQIPAAPAPNVIVADNSAPQTGVGPCPSGVPGTPGVAGDPQASL